MLQSVLRIRDILVRIRIRILIFLSVASRWQPKISFLFYFFSFYLLKIHLR